jgi:hypothetical protein
MEDVDTLSHTTWDCKYNVAFRFCPNFHWARHRDGELARSIVGNNLGCSARLPRHLQKRDVVASIFCHGRRMRSPGQRGGG